MVELPYYSLDATVNKIQAEIKKFTLDELLLLIEQKIVDIALPVTITEPIKLIITSQNTPKEIKDYFVDIWIKKSRPISIIHTSNFGTINVNKENKIIVEDDRFAITGWSPKTLLKINPRTFGNLNKHKLSNKYKLDSLVSFPFGTQLIIENEIDLEKHFIVAKFIDISNTPIQFEVNEVVILNSEIERIISIIKKDSEIESNIPTNIKKDKRYWEKVAKATQDYYLEQGKFITKKDLANAIAPYTNIVPASLMRDWLKNLKILSDVKYQQGIEKIKEFDLKFHDLD